MTAPLFSDPGDRTLALPTPTAAPPVVDLFREPPAHEESKGDDEIAAVLAAAAAGRRSGPQPRVRN
ncbi:hypothetical protein AB0M29_44725 [Streptomyces sp. NPDC051976]|uniref:hypothetical protein n=1 Tax=Streptomyces sp. NPDC051976 TaxID=3154947 RepID=UPI003434B58F